MVAFAVNIPSFQDSRFHVIDSVWESESFVGLRNFTLMAVIQRRRAVPGSAALAKPHLLFGFLDSSVIVAIKATIQFSLR